MHVAGCLTRAAGQEATVARLGGDEFAVLLPIAATGDAASAVAERIVETLGETVVIEGVQVRVRASIGISLAPTHARDVVALLRHADHAMYQAKVHHRGIRIHDPSHAHPPGQSGLAVLAELREAVLKGAVTVHVQPQARTDTAHVYGAEALIRWNHPQLGVLPPSEFLPLAKRHGLIDDLTRLVLDHAVAAAAAWRADGLDLSVAVNLTPDSLVDGTILTTVETVLRRHGLPPSRLTLEITEDSVISDPARTIAWLAALRATGVRLSVDDFGTGYSSLSYLKRLPVHEVKVDKSFVTKMCHDPDDATIVRSIVDLAGNLSLDVVAEGVEDQTTWDRLRSLGCTAAQGYHLSRPMPLEEFAPWLEHHEQQRARQQASAGRHAKSSRPTASSTVPALRR